MILSAGQVELMKRLFFCFLFLGGGFQVKGFINRVGLGGRDAAVEYLMLTIEAMFSGAVFPRLICLGLHTSLIARTSVFV